MYKHLLVPLDGSGLATEIVSQAVAFAAALGARITFFTARADFARTDHGALQRSVAPAAFIDNLAGEAHGLLQKAEAAAQAKGVDCSSVIRTSDHPATAILAEAQTSGCDLIFMASHGHKGLWTLVIGSQTQKVLAGTQIPVLVASVKSNQLEPEKQTALAIIQDEHRSLAAVVHGLQHLVGEAVAGRADLDVALVRSMIHYIDAFPERLHHPKEEAHLFRRLSERTPDFDGVIAQLRAQHTDGTSLVRAMEDALDRCTTQPDKAADAWVNLVTAVNTFAQAQWAHMNLEENTLLPAACLHLTRADWAEICAAFSMNGDTDFNRDVDDEFKQLYTKIMNLTKKSNL